MSAKLCLQNPRQCTNGGIGPPANGDSQGQTTSSAMQKAVQNVP